MTDGRGCCLDRDVGWSWRDGAAAPGFEHCRRLLIGDDDYLRTFLRARESILARMDSLAALIADNQRQYENLALLRPAMQARLGALLDRARQP